MSDNKKIVDKIKDNKKEIGENVHVIAIILLVAFIIVDIFIILYLINENDKYHVIFSEVSKLEATQIRDYLVEQGVEASLNQSGQVVVPKDSVDVSVTKVNSKFYNTLPKDTSTNDIDIGDEIIQTETVIDVEYINTVTEIENKIKDFLENHVAINNADVRIYDYKNSSFDVTVTVVITLRNGMDLLNADIDTISWYITGLVDGSETDNILLINADNNLPFEGGIQSLLP